MAGNLCLLDLLSSFPFHWRHDPTLMEHINSIVVFSRSKKKIIPLYCHTKFKVGVWTSLNMWLVVNSLAPGRCDCNFKNVIFNLVLLIGIFRSFHDNALRWMPPDLIDDKSTLVRVMAWCRQATSHYLNQCWPRSPTPYGITRPQWVNDLSYCPIIQWLGVWFFSSEWFIEWKPIQLDEP